MEPPLTALLPGLLNIYLGDSLEVAVPVEKSKLSVRFDTRFELMISERSATRRILEL